MRIAPAEVHVEDYAVSHDLNRVARITAAGHAGQILLSAAVAELVSRVFLPRRRSGGTNWITVAVSKDIYLTFL